MPSLAERVERRFQFAAEAVIEDRGEFFFEYLPQHRQFVEPIGKLVHEAVAKYVQAGIPARTKFLLSLNGKGASHALGIYIPGQSPPRIAISPKAFKKPGLLHTIIHEIGHYVHDKLVTGGFDNPDIIAKYRWAVREKPTGAGSTKDQLARSTKLNALDRAGIAKEIMKLVPRKGKIVEYDEYLSPPSKHRVTVRVLGKGTVRRMDFSGELLKYEPQSDMLNKRLTLYRKSPEGYPVINDLSAYELAKSIDPELVARHSQLENAQMDTDRAFSENQRKQFEEIDDYSSQRHEWAPTTYSRKNPVEWFAEMCVTHVMGHLKPEPAAWLVSVVK